MSRTLAALLATIAALATTALPAAAQGGPRGGGGGGGGGGRMEAALFNGITLSGAEQSKIDSIDGRLPREAKRHGRRPPADAPIEARARPPTCARSSPRTNSRNSTKTSPPCGRCARVAAVAHPNDPVIRSP